MLFESIVYTLIFSLCFAELDETLLFCQSLPPKLTNGLIKRDRVSYYKEQGYLGNMEYMCLPGFDLIGKRIIMCQNGMWTTMPQCITKTRCLPIKTYPINTEIESEDITLFQNDPQQIIFGSTITLRCIDNYEFDSTSQGSLILHCQSDGSWTSMPSCRVAQPTCDYSKLYLPARSRITRMNFKFSEYNRQLHTVGSNLEYSCEDGYRLHDGQSSLIVECLNSGSWSTLPVCEFVYETEPITTRCNYPVYIKNGFITLYNVTIWEDQTYTGRIIYECNYGFETFDGNDQIISDCINGTWTTVVDCQEISTCPKQDLLEIESEAQHSYVKNVSLQYIRDPLAFVYNSYVLRVCLPNFEHDPSSPPLKIQCQRYTNTWTGIPICRALQTITTKMVVTESEDDHLTTTITSKVVYDTTHTMFCRSNDIPSFPNTISIQSKLNVMYDIGTILFYTCQTGYELLFNQTNFIICSMNGTWLIDGINKTMCQLRNETTVMISVDTSTMVSNTTEGNDMSINLDETLPDMNDSNESFISSDRSISAANRQIRQINSYCKEFPEILHAQLLSDDTIKYNLSNEITYSGSVLFICQVGFISDNSENEPFRLTCQNGIFHPKVICIEKPRCSLPPPIDSARSSVVDSLINVFDTSTDEAIPGSFILLKCFDKTNNEESVFNMTCLENGQWLKPPPPCIAPFKRRCQSGITIPNARTQIYAKLTTDGYYDDGSKATYRCLENFVHDQESGPLYIQCRNGRWGPRPRCVPKGCLEPMPDTIENGWKSAESYIIQGDTKYFLLSRYSCHPNAIMINSSSRVIDIECRNGQWQYESLPECQLQE